MTSLRRDINDCLITPHGGTLKERLIGEKKSETLKNNDRYFPLWDLTERQLCGLEMIMNGGFSPLEGFWGKSDYNTVVRDMRLSDGTLWPIPVTLDVTEEFASKVTMGSSIALRNPEGKMFVFV